MTNFIDAHRASDRPRPTAGPDICTCDAPGPGMPASVLVQIREGLVSEIRCTWCDRVIELHSELYADDIPATLQYVRGESGVPDWYQLLPRVPVRAVSL